jgi:Bacterial Ig-like domain (group 3)
MSTHDQLEIVGPGGQIRFYELNPAKGFTNIGSHPDNDIVINSPVVAAFHAILDHRQKPAQLIVLGRGGRVAVAGASVEPNSTRVVNNWDTIELDGHSLVLMESMTGTPASSFVAPSPSGSFTTPPAAAYIPPAALAPVFLPPVPPPLDAGLPPQAPLPVTLAPPVAGVNAPIPDHIDDIILTEISARDFTLNVEEPATFDLTIINGGDIVATFNVTIEGLDYDWVIVPAPVNLLDGQRATVQVNFTAPRRPTSRAGTHYFSATITSNEYPGHVSRLGCMLVLNPYFEHTVSELSPRQQGLGWTKSTGLVNYNIVNHGNSDAGYRLDAVDDERALQFEFKLAKDSPSLAKQAELRLAPEDGRQIAVNFTLLNKKFFAFGNHFHSFTVTTTPLQSQEAPRTLLAQAESWPLIGPIHLFIVALLLLVAIAFIFRPKVYEFQADKPQILSSELMAGDKVNLSWNTSWFADVKIDPDLSNLAKGSGSVDVTPQTTTTYRLTASTPLLSQIFSAWFSATQEFTVEVDPKEPIVRKFDLDKVQVLTGQSATLSWDVLNADELTLSINGALETIPKEQYTSSRVLNPTGPTTIILQARNHFWPDPVSRTTTLNAINPTATPFPLPVIERFDASPDSIIAGDNVTLSWTVTNAEKVIIDPGGQEFPPTGKIELKPDQTTDYILTAINGSPDNSARSIRKVTVSPPPTPSPVPGTPLISFFSATPLEVALGSSEINNIQLAWAVTGDLTGIELSGDTIGTLTGLPNQGTQIVSAGDKDTEFTLTARNGTLTASQSVTIKVVTPLPIISGLSPASTTNVGGSGFTLTVTGSNFVNGSTVQWNGSDRSTNFVSATQLTATITSADIAKSGTAPITVFNPAEAGGGASTAATFYINNPVPVLSTLSQNVSPVASPDLTLILTGSNFVTDSTVRWNNEDVETTYTNATTLSAKITTDKFATAGTASVTVFNPSPGGGTSGAKDYAVDNPVPKITSLGPPPSVAVGSGQFTLTINGANFVSGVSQVSWDGDIRDANFISATQLQIVLAGSDVQQPGSINVSVVNTAPGGGVSNSVTYTITRAPVNITLSASPVSAVTGQGVSFTATVDPVSPADCLPSPCLASYNSSDPSSPIKVEFYINGVLFDTQPLSGSGPVSATSTAFRFPVSAPVITAKYLGNTNFEDKTSAPFNFTITKANSTVSVTSNSASSPLGTAVTFTATVNASNPGSINTNYPDSTPTYPSGGTVQFYRNGTPIGSPVALGANGQTSYTTVTGDLPGGVNQITATYDATSDSNFNDGATLSPYQQTVTKAKPVITMTTSPTSTTYGTPVTLSADITSAISGLTPANGTVEFWEGGTKLGSVVFTGNPATVSSISFTAAASPHTLFAKYIGTADPNFTDNTSGNYSLSVAKFTPTISFVSASNPAPTYGTNVTYTAGVSSSVGTPTGGSVSFYSDSPNGVICTAALSAGNASCTINTVSGGSRSITARFTSSDGNFNNQSSSPTYAMTVTPASLSASNFSFTGPSVNGGVLTGAFANPVWLDPNPNRSCWCWSWATWTVTITAPSGLQAPTGNIAFTYRNSYIGGGQPPCITGGVVSFPYGTWTGGPTANVGLSGNSAQASTFMAKFIGGWTISAVYLGDNNYTSFTLPTTQNGLTVPCPAPP